MRASRISRAASPAVASAGSITGARETRSPSSVVNSLPRVWVPDCSCCSRSPRLCRKKLPKAGLAINSSKVALGMQCTVTRPRATTSQQGGLPLIIDG